MFERYVFTHLPGEAKPVPAGLFTLDIDLNIGLFSYGRKYLLRSNAIPIDPVNLPLSEKQFALKKNNGIFFVLGDILPDSWGKYVLSKKLRIPFGSLAPYEYFNFINSNNAVGSLSLGASLEVQETTSDPPIDFSDIHLILKAYNTLTTADTIPDEVLCILGQGTSLGGAQPKSPIRHEGEDWIAKFKNKKVLVDFPAVEFATMRLAHECGIGIPEIRLEDVAGEKVYLIKRFDRKNAVRVPFISGHALSCLDIDELEQGSYLLLAKFIRQISKHASADLEQLFRRMVFNIAVGNADDHLRNHGWLYSSQCNWRLSPAYDLLPIPRKTSSFSLSLIVGRYGTQATFENALSRCEQFNLSVNQAKSVVNEVINATSNWKRFYADNGVTDKDLREIEACFSLVDKA